MMYRLRLPAISALAAAIVGFPARAATGCQLVKLAELPVTMAGLRPLVPAKINGKDALFLVDSGAFYSIMTTGAVEKYGLSTSAAPFGFYLKGVGGGQNEMRASARSLSSYTRASR